MAQKMGAALDAEIDAGRASEDEVFDVDYKPIVGSNPAQLMTRKTAITDRLFPAFQEPALGIDERVVFCAACDVNGYIPTHNNKFSKPQGDNPVWNMANSRNRRLFNDRTGLNAGQGKRPFLVQTYRRDMGGGNFALMKDVSVPIKVKGRHWGAVRLGYRA